jgi:hypothetical protein
MDIFVVGFRAEDTAREARVVAGKSAENRASPSHAKSWTKKDH